MYNPERFFVPNDIERYSIGTKNKDLTLGPDRSLTIYVQHTRPEGDKASMRRAFATMPRIGGERKLRRVELWYDTARAARGRAAVTLFGMK